MQGKRISQDIKDKISNDYIAGELPKAISSKYGVSIQTVYNIINRKKFSLK